MPKFQTKPQPLLAVFILALGLVWIWASRTTPTSQDRLAIQAPHQGFLAPQFELANENGEITALADFRGQIVVLNYWASWCPPCRAEMPALDAAFKDYQDQGVVILGINAASQDSIETAHTFITEMGLSFPILFDKTGAVGGLYQVSALPSTYFIDRNGVIQEVVIGGPISASHLRISIEQLIGVK